MKITTHQKTTIEVFEAFANSTLDFDPILSSGQKVTLVISDHQEKQTLEIQFSKSDFQSMLMRSINNLSYSRSEANKRFLSDLLEASQKILGEYVAKDLEESREKEGLL